MTLKPRVSSLLRQAGKLRNRSLPEIADRSVQALSARLERLRAVAPAVARGTATGSAGLAAPALPPLSSGSRTARFDQDQAAADRLIAAADRILSNRFTLLGHPDLDFGTPIDWHLDPISGRRAPRIHWSRIPYLNADVVGDHKVVWEINRHQHFYVLGRAYRLTGDERYARRFAQHLESWMDENPPRIGINWASSLEIAYRAIAWLWAFDFFRDSPALTPALLHRAIGYLDVHGRHLERYLSTYFSPNTHLTGEALGLLYLGVSLPWLKRAPKWRAKGWKILVDQLPRQVHPDGVYFEQASYYHRYTVDIYLHAVIVARRGGVPVPPAMLERLDLAVRHLADLTRSDSTIPIIGDDDGGRLAWFEERDFMDVRSSLAVASVVLDRREYAAIAGRATEEVFWLLGPDGVTKVDEWAAATPTPSHLSRLYPVGGYAILRDGWGPDANHAVLDCGPLGTMNCGHAHSDALAIEVAVAGCPVVVDPGTFTYTASATERDRFRHSASHNTVVVDGQSASVPAGPFSWAIRTDARHEQWWSGQYADWFVGSHPGFQRLPDPVTHRRSALFVHHGYWIIVDSILAAGEHESVVNWHMAIGAEVAPISRRTARISAPHGERRAGLLFVAAGDVDSLEWDVDWVSPSYGSRTLAPRARIVSRGCGRRDIVTVLAPTDGVGPVELTELDAGEGRALLLTRPGMHDLFLFGTHGRVSAAGVEGVADAALVRRSAGGEVESVALFGADARLTLDGRTLRAKGGGEWSSTDFAGS